MFTESLLTAMLVLVLSTPVLSQDALPSIDEQLETFTKEYALTEEQQQAVRPLMEENRAALKPIFESIKKEESKREKFKLFRKIKEEQADYRDDLAKVLTKEQMEKYDAKVKERRDKIKESIREKKEGSLTRGGAV